MEESGLQENGRKERRVWESKKRMRKRGGEWRRMGRREMESLGEKGKER